MSEEKDEVVGEVTREEGGKVTREEGGTSQVPEGLENFLRRAGFVAFRRAGRLLASERQAAECARQTLAHLWLAGPPEDDEALAVELVRQGDRDCLPLMAGGAGLRNEWLKHMERHKGKSPEELALRDQLVDWLAPLAQDDQSVLVHHYVDGVSRDQNAHLCQLTRANIDRRLELFAEQVGGIRPEGAPHPFPADSHPAKPDQLAAEQACLADKAEGAGDLTQEQKRWREEVLADELTPIAQLVQKMGIKKKPTVSRLMNKSILAPAIAATLAVGLLLLAAWPSQTPLGIPAPDQDPYHVQMVVSRAFKTRNFKPEERLHPGDVLAYRVALREQAYVVVAGLAPEGKARFPFEKGPLNWPVGPSTKMLPLYTNIDGTITHERIFFFFCKEIPEEPEDLLELLEQAYPFNRQGRRDISEQRLQNTGNCEVRSQVVFVDPEAKKENAKEQPQ